MVNAAEFRQQKSRRLGSAKDFQCNSESVIMTETLEFIIIP